MKKATVCIIFVSALIIALLGGLLLANNNEFAGVIGIILLIVAAILYLLARIIAIITLAQQRQWGWLIALAVTFVPYPLVLLIPDIICMIVYAFAGPSKPAVQLPSPHPPMNPTYLVICPSCGFASPVGNAFCVRCGHTF